jgi:hypothetical protein
MKRVVAIAAALVTMAVFGSAATAGARGAAKPAASPLKAGLNTAPFSHWCNTDGITCTEPFQNWEDSKWFPKTEQHVNISDYIGHDEPSVLFYSGKRGAGYDNTYTMVLPKEATLRPQQDGSGGTWNFQLHPAFWIGMAMCDDGSAPNPNWSGSLYPDSTHCQPDSDRNIYVGTDPSDMQRYIGAHPGVAYMEMQFYPPGWVPWPVGNSCDAYRYCAALNIDSLSWDFNTNDINNNDCLNTAGLEPVNFAYITKNGVATSSASPLNGDRFNLDPSKDFFMNAGDKIKVHMYDTPAGFTVGIDDQTSGKSGSMVASVANGFARVNFDPTATTCTTTPQAYHPAYATSTELTNVPWAAHTYNVAYSDEIGHFEYCNLVNADANLSCQQGGGFDTKTTDIQDDNYCLPVPGYPPSNSTLINVKGCLGVLGDSDLDFDGVSYDAHAWPGTTKDPTADAILAPRPIMFTSPTFGEDNSNFARVAFEADLPRIEDFRPDAPFGGVLRNCQRFITNPADPKPGANCVLPPPQSRFYPFYLTTTLDGQCIWEEGGKWLPHTNDFGGVKQYGSLVVNTYPSTDNAGNPAVTTRYNDFRMTLSYNPCPAGGGN